MKKGAPTKAVTTPIGVSAGFDSIRPGRSARIKKAAPAIKESGSKRRCPAPAISRTMCGTTSPTYQINPLTETTAAVPRVAAMTMTSLVRATFIPSVAASSPPTLKTSRCRRCARSTRTLTAT